MIKKLLATTLATLSVASMSIPAMAGGPKNVKSQTNQQNKSQENDEFIVVDTEEIKEEMQKQLISEFEDGKIVLSDDEKKKIDKEIEEEMKTKFYTAEVIKVNNIKEEAKKTNLKEDDFVNVDVEYHQKEAMQNELRSQAYTTMKHQVRSFRKNILTPYSKWDGGVNSTLVDALVDAPSGIFNAGKDVVAITKIGLCHPIESTKYVLNNKEKIAKSKAWKGIKFAYNWLTGNKDNKSNDEKK